MNQWVRKTLLGMTLVSLTLVLAAATRIGWWACLAAPPTFVLVAAAWIAVSVRRERRVMREFPPQRVLVCGHAWTTTNLFFAKINPPQQRFREWEGPFATIILCRMCAPTRQSMTARKGSPDNAKVASRIVGVREWPWGTLGSMWSKVWKGVREEVQKAAREAHEQTEDYDQEDADWWKEPDDPDVTGPHSRS